MSRKREMPEPIPLEMLGADKVAEIMAAVRNPKPPPRWLDLGCAQIQSRAWFEWHKARGRDPRKRRESLPQKVRLAVIDRDGYTCGLCGDPVDPTDVHIDHIHPKSQGGTDELGNLQVSHSRCNILKGAQCPG